MARPIRFARLVAFLLLALLILPLAACAGLTREEAQRQIGEISAAVDAGEARLADVDKLIAQADTPEERAALQATRDEMSQRLAEARRYVALLQTALEQSVDGDPGSTITAGSTAAAGLLPPPYNLIAIVAGPVLGSLVTSVVEARRRRRLEAERQKLEAAAKDVVVAIEHEKADGDGVVDFTSAATKASLRSRMSTEARELVETFRRDTPPIVRAIAVEPIAPAARN